MPAPEMLYLDGGDSAICTILHPPVPAAARDAAVILCPPFGWDEVCSYRSRREWARRLAAAGYATIRISFPGTGDSAGSPRDPARLDVWTAAVGAAARWGRTATGARRLTAIGIGLGGLVAYRATATGAPIDDLVLWATPARGRVLVRQLRAFSKLELSSLFEGTEQPRPLAPGELEAGGFLLSAQTVAELEGLDLTALTLERPASRRVLLAEQDGIPVDEALREQLQSRGVAVTVTAGKGYALMTSHPQQARAPIELIERVTEWLDEVTEPRSAASAVDPLRTPGTGHSAEIATGHGAYIRETPFTVQQTFGDLAGVLSEPLGRREPGLCAVLLNAGAVRRIGPNRMWVEMARRWAARGVPTLRLDVEGLGDADGDAGPYSKDDGLYVPELVAQVLAALDALQERGVGERFVLGGLCAGAYWSFHAALQDSRVTAALMLNPRALIWDPALAPARDLRTLITEPRSWARLREQASVARVRALVVWIFATPMRLLSRLRAHGARAPAVPARIDDALELLHASGKRVLLLFSDHEPLHGELIRSGRMAQLERSANVTIALVPVRDHTLRPIWAQRQAHDALDRALDREIAISRTAEPSTRASSPTG